VCLGGSLEITQISVNGRGQAVAICCMTPTLLHLSRHRLEVRSVYYFDKLWDDRGTASAPHDVGFWRLKQEEGAEQARFYPLGDIAERSHLLDPQCMCNGENLGGSLAIVRVRMGACVCCSSMRVHFPARLLSRSPICVPLDGGLVVREIMDEENPGDPSLPARILAFPCEYRLMWTDRGAGAKFGQCAIWKPLPPPGYVSFGYVATTSRTEAPALDRVVCIHKRLVEVCVCVGERE
jgi:Vacuolar protein sorting-associated protein 62